MVARVLAEKRRLPLDLVAEALDTGTASRLLSLEGFLREHRARGRCPDPAERLDHARPVFLLLALPEHRDQGPPRLLSLQIADQTDHVALDHLLRIEEARNDPPGEGIGIGLPQLQDRAIDVAPNRDHTASRDLLRPGRLVCLSTYKASSYVGTEPSILSSLHNCAQARYACRTYASMDLSPLGRCTASSS